MLGSKVGSATPRAEASKLLLYRGSSALIDDTEFIGNQYIDFMLCSHNTVTSSL